MEAEMETQNDFSWELFSEKTENRKVRLDCGGAHIWHVRPRPGTPKVARNYIQNTHRIQEPFCSEETTRIMKNDIEKVSKRVTLYRANWPWAHIGAPWLPRSDFQIWRINIIDCRTCNQELEITPKSSAEGPRTTKKKPERHIWNTGPGNCAKRLQ